MRRAAREREFIYLIVSHDLSAEGRICDRLAVMKGGEIVEILDVEA
ncbi:peptide/nickel transport system ATP-binding protein [Litoreibacter meonggei]|uniref:Peptide/nickel transport system ATP-binding protein n=2 Tax=Litoreibacter meonggei TaxID=1049199 RepID=A0A497VQ56_9RHOB|nr:peptide/nickel transport system ATP-binding protein [Litoreibacter meonggei]